MVNFDIIKIYLIHFVKEMLIFAAVKMLTLKLVMMR